ncbi:MAG: hypothetical protein ACREQF_08010, partial [Candidatus Binataceae bacterium]
MVDAEQPGRHDVIRAQELLVRRLPCVLLILACVVAIPRPAVADKLDEIRQRRVLRWGGDQEGGG